ncbi:MAG TPA: LuxR C-terminal-related transcriptional regulator [Acidimicrobiia bacterium]
MTALTNRAASKELASALTDIETAPPPLHPGLVERKRLIERLVTATTTDVITITAPAGFGKSTLLAQYARSRRKRPAWLSLSRIDNDPTTLLTHLADAMHRAGQLGVDDPSLLRFGVNSGVSRGISVLLGAFDPVTRPTLILDNAEVVNRNASRDVLRELVRRLGGRAQIVIASRSSVPLPIPQIRSSGQLLELTEHELAMTQSEALEMIVAEGLPLDDVAERIIELCEGWPVALHLISLAFARGEREWAPFEIGGDVRFMTEYLAEEVVKSLSRAQYEFLTMTSILDQLTGPLCDAVLETTDSSRRLRKIEDKTHLVQAVDLTGDWYRTNRVIRDALRVELRREVPPDTVIGLHERAAAWYEGQGMPDAAIHHARLAGDHERFARLLGSLMRTSYAAGGASLVIGWMSWLESTSSLDQFPEIAAVGSLIHALEGDGLEADRWLEFATRGSVEKQVTPVVRLVRALATPDGIDVMLTDARAARSSMDPGSEWLPAAILVEGLAYMWSGDTVAAEPLIAEAVTLGERPQSDLSITVGLAERALICVLRGEWDRGDDFAQRALARIDERSLDGYATSALALVMAARTARHRGDVAQAQTMLARAALIRPQLNSAIPGLAVQVGIEMARAYVELSDVVGARAVIRDANDVLLQRPDLGTLPDQLEELKNALKNLGPGTVGPSALTKAELRLLPLLATYLTFPEIGDRLFISRHTVKTQAMSIYRKLGTSSRSEAVARALEIGLLVQ